MKNQLYSNAWQKKAKRLPPKKLRDARKKGQVAKSQDFPFSVLKLKIATEAVKNQKAVNQIASEHGIAPAAQVKEWKKQLLEEGTRTFQSRRRTKTLEPTFCKA